MKLTFLGAAHEVTGSCSLLEVNGKNLLIDCGMQQGKDIYENQEIPVAASKIDAVFLTHAHIDHSGLLPLLFSQGFRGKIYMTTASRELCKIMLADSAHIQESEAEWRNRKAKRTGGALYVPIYTSQDVVGTLGLMRGCEYNKPLQVFKDINLRFIDAGHLMGSSCIELTLIENGEKRVLVFSGDIGNTGKPIIKNPQPLTTADYVVMESTYGDRLHGAKPDYTKELSEVIKRTFDRGGNVVIPTFAIGRMQEMLYLIRQIKHDNLVPKYPSFPVYVDSPLAVEATKIFQSVSYDYFDDETMELINQGINPLSFDGLRLSSTTDESKAINATPESKVILSASGMCEAGRIRHHLKHNLWRAESTILMVGYQSEGTIGRALLDGAREVNLFGEPVLVNAEVTMLNSISSHADKIGLINWAKQFVPSPTRIFVNHGADGVCDSFAEELNKETGVSAVAPYSGESWDLITNERLNAGNRQLVSKKPAARTAKVKSPVFNALMNALERLKKVVMHNEGGANHDLRKFTRDIDSLCNKWDR